MGRKKKETTEQTTKVSDQKEKETNKSTSGSIGYQGKINVKVQRGNQTVSNKTYNNNGNTNLFKFLCDCLSGYYQESSRPVKIALFNRGDTDEYPEQFNTWNFTKSKLSSPLTIVYSNTPKPETGNNTVSITYDFKIPYIYLTNDVYKVAIYPFNKDVDSQKSSTGEAWSWSAAFGFLDEDNKWDPINISNSSKQYYTLLISWTMTLGNQNKGGNE